MANTIIMSKYQGLGNDYLILDPKKNQVQLQVKKMGNWACVFLTQTEVNLPSVETACVFLPNI